MPSIRGGHSQKIRQSLFWRKDCNHSPASSPVVLPPPPSFTTKLRDVRTQIIAVMISYLHHVCDFAKITFSRNNNYNVNLNFLLSSLSSHANTSLGRSNQSQEVWDFESEFSVLNSVANGTMHTGPIEQRLLPLSSGNYRHPVSSPMVLPPTPDVRTQTIAVMISYLHHVCDFAKKTVFENNNYSANLNSLLSSLSSHANSNMQFYNTTSAENTSDPVYGLFLCHGMSLTKDVEHASRHSNQSQEVWDIGSEFSVSNSVDNGTVHTRPIEQQLLPLSSDVRTQTSAVLISYLHHVCDFSKTTFSRNNIFSANLNSLLSSLSSYANNSLKFYNTTSTENTSDPVYGLFLYRKDVLDERCRDMRGGCREKTPQSLFQGKDFNHSSASQSIVLPPTPSSTTGIKESSKQMLTFMSEEHLDVDPYILVMTIWTIVTDSFEVYVGYEPQWYLKEPLKNPVPLVEDLELVDFDPTLLYDVPPPPAPPVEAIGENEIIDLISDTE
ncbi:Cysteine-rich receptor-like protein kinase 25 [Morella rubra]|uniref:Cysteine-rich receptor-like protein kinase 25 n=1 Tax=Morella rubra TaxID=262757 RepID=A0A6A1V1M6_9ROSI|nr:Cysteine-rich receptor-like protein kinase 25 [Morella rubra]